MDLYLVYEEARQTRLLSFEIHRRTAVQNPVLAGRHNLEMFLVTPKKFYLRPFARFMVEPGRKLYAMCTVFVNVRIYFWRL